MLKIKDNVDLKQLEKFGFRKVEDYYIIMGRYFAHIRIGENKHIEFRDEFYYIEDFNMIDVLFDLIQAGLVEKIEKEDM